MDETRQLRQSARKRRRPRALYGLSCLALTWAGFSTASVPAAVKEPPRPWRVSGSLGEEGWQGQAAYRLGSRGDLSLRASGREAEVDEVGVGMVRVDR